MVAEHRKRPYFLAEQDGPYERVLKERLKTVFRNGGFIDRAYLVQADLQDGGGVGVILAVRAPPRDERKLADEIGVIFSSIFHKDVHLDILFLTDHTESRVRTIAKPFFERRGNPDSLRK